MVTQAWLHWAGRHEGHSRHSRSPGRLGLGMRGQMGLRAGAVPEEPGRWGVSAGPSRNPGPWSCLLSQPGAQASAGY